MTRNRLRRDLRLLKLWSASSALCVAGLAAAAFGRQPAAPLPAEMTLQRLNVVDADGTLRLVVAGKDRMHPGVMDGVTIDRPRPVAGMIFFNDQGDEVGGLTYTGREAGGTRTANAGIMFDQLKQDQTIGFEYDEQNGRRSAGFQVWDRSEAHLSELIAKLNAAKKISDPAEQASAVRAARASAPRGPRRVFVGKQEDRSAVVALADGSGQVRLRLKVDQAGAATIEFLDAAGKVVDRLPR